MAEKRALDQEEPDHEQQEQEQEEEEGGVTEACTGEMPHKRVRVEEVMVVTPLSKEKVVVVAAVPPPPPVVARLVSSVFECVREVLEAHATGADSQQQVANLRARAFCSAPSHFQREARNALVSLIGTKGAHAHKLDVDKLQTAFRRTAECCVLPPEVVDRVMKRFAVACRRSPSPPSSVSA